MSLVLCKGCIVSGCTGRRIKGCLINVNSSVTLGHVLHWTRGMFLYLRPYGHLANHINKTNPHVSSLIFRCIAICHMLNLGKFIHIVEHSSMLYLLISKFNMMKGANEWNQAWKRMAGSNTLKTGIFFLSPMVNRLVVITQSAFQTLLILHYQDLLLPRQVCSTH